MFSGDLQVYLDNKSRKAAPPARPLPSDTSAKQTWLGATRAPRFWGDKDTEFCLSVMKELNITGSFRREVDVNFRREVGVY